MIKSIEEGSGQTQKTWSTLSTFLCLMIVLRIKFVSVCSAWDFANLAFWRINWHDAIKIFMNLLCHKLICFEQYAVHSICFLNFISVLLWNRIDEMNINMYMYTYVHIIKNYIVNKHTKTKDSSNRLSQ